MSDPVTEKFQELTGRVLEHVKAPAKDQVIEILNEAAVEVLAESAARAEAMGRVVEAMGKAKVQFGLIGAAVGTAAGALVAFNVAYRKAEKKFSEIADLEIEEMQKHYRAKTRALEAEAAKAPLADLVAEKGYVSPEIDTTEPPPMAVAPPRSVVEAAEEEEDEPVIRNVFEEVQSDHEWNWKKEHQSRRPNVPYVVHYDEKDEVADEYESVTLTYYEGDDVLCDDRDNILDPADRDDLVGDKNMERFGHGSNDINVVYIRNDRLEILYEVVKSPNHYAEEVQGFDRGDISHEEYNRRNLRRMRERERDVDEY